jgi:hypothetical protein
MRTLEKRRKRRKKMSQRRKRPKKRILLVKTMKIRLFRRPLRMHLGSKHERKNLF